MLCLGEIRIKMTLFKSFNDLSLKVVNSAHSAILQEEEAERTYPFQFLEVLPEKSDGIFRSGYAKLHDAILEDLLHIMSLNVVFAFT